MVVDVVRSQINTRGPGPQKPTNTSRRSIDHNALSNKIQSWRLQTCRDWGLET